ncbi:uncharacterized protein TNCV_1071661 [Trichonephila clavipes]|nr:uncharacterized protein TNCV_1071661 [Trichonephila clavipes]
MDSYGENEKWKRKGIPMCFLSLNVSDNCIKDLWSSGHLQLTAQKLLESFYVDNCLTSVDNAEDIERFMLESKEILSASPNSTYVVGAKKIGAPLEQQGTRNTSIDQPRRLKHIPGILNPADLPSQRMWCSRTYCIVMVEGPSWLNKPREEWPLSEACPDRATIDSERKENCCFYNQS